MVGRPVKLACLFLAFVSTNLLVVTNISLSIVSLCIIFILVGKSLFTLDPSKKDEAIDLITKISDPFTDVSLKVTYHNTWMGSI